MTNKIPGIPGVTFQPEVMQAYYFANAAHAAVGQRRNYTGEPYIVHPVAVLKILLDICPKMVSPDMMMATLLHDVVEDTGVTGELIRELFGPRVADMVRALSKATTPSFGNRAERHAVEVARLASSDWKVQTIKVGDLMQNTGSIAARDPVFARTYLVEKKQLLDAMTGALMSMQDAAHAQLKASAAALGVTL
jgi:(p)ppGpp synthase/HD superfamily hydrolase